MYVCPPYFNRTFDGFVNPQSDHPWSVCVCVWEVSREAAVTVAPPVFSGGRTVRDQWQSHRPPCPASKL